MNVTLEDAYAEACKALGETIVRERLITAQLRALAQSQQDPEGPDETGEDQ